MRALLALFALGLLVFAHEFGHLLMARVFGVYASRVKFGMGPALFRTRRGTTWLSIGALPLGGYVELEGENPHRASSYEEAGGFTGERSWKRLFILAAGPLMNVVVAVACLFVLYMTGTHLPVPLTVGLVAPGSAGARVQLRPGDRISEVDGQALSSWSQLVEKIGRKPGQPVVLTVEHREGTGHIAVTPTADDLGVGHLGIAQQYTYQVLPAREALGQAVRHAGWLARAELRLSVRLVEGSRGKGLSAAGQVVRQATAVASNGLDALLRVFAGLSIALTLFYLLPLPALDGGRMLIVAGEAISKRRLSPRMLTLVQTLGLALILGLLVWVAFADAQRLLTLAR